MIINFFIAPFQFFYTDKSISSDIKFFSILLILIPVVLISGPALPDIFLSLIGFYFLSKSIWQKKWQYYQNPLFIGFLLFSIYGLLRSIFSEMPMESLMTGGSIFYFRYIFFVLGVWYLLEKNPYLSRCLLNTSVISLVIICSDALYQYFFGFNIIGNPKFDENRLTGFFGDEPIIGRYIAYLVTFVFALIYQNFSKNKKIMYMSLLLLILCNVTVFLSGERAPLFYLILFSILILIYISNYRIYIFINIFFSIIIISGITFLNSNAKNRIVDLTIKQVSQTELPFLPYSNHHEEHYISSLKIFNDNKIFGIGPNLFRFQCGKNEYKYKLRSCSTHPHNFYIQVLAEMGLVGFMFLLIFFSYLSLVLLKKLLYCLKTKKDEQKHLHYLLYLIPLFIYWWPLIPHMNLYNNWNNVLMMLPLGFYMRYLYGNLKYGNFNQI